MFLILFALHCFEWFMQVNSTLTYQCNANVNFHVNVYSHNCGSVLEKHITYILYTKPNVTLCAKGTNTNIFSESV